MIYDTDKFDLGYMEHIYNDLFKDRTQNTTKLLEIGVLNGGSVKYWRDLFENATIYAVDINRCNNLNNEKNVEHIVGNAYSSRIKDLFEDNSLDIIIDDGPHSAPSFVYLIEYYIAKLKSGGLMVIEDIIFPDLTPKLIDILNKQPFKTKHTVYDMRYKQKTDKLLNMWANGLDVLVIERL